MPPAIVPEPPPLAVLVAGSERHVDRLRAGLPSVALCVLPDATSAQVRARSARAHLAVALGDRHACAGGATLFDAVVRTEKDLESFILRAQGFDDRRRAHALPPDLGPSLAPWTRSWAGDATRIGARVSQVFAQCGVAAVVDHIGSTSVPGLPAKDVIDLQVTVRRLADADACDLALRAAGFVNVQLLAPGAPGVNRDLPRGASSEPEDWEKRLFASVDEDRRVIVHVRRAGAANWRYALLFRDWLRDNDDRRDEYAQVKAHLAGVHREDSGFDDYARAKDFWFDSAFEDSEQWAARVSWTHTAAL